MTSLRDVKDEKKRSEYIDKELVSDCTINVPFACALGVNKCRVKFSSNAINCILLDLPPAFTIDVHVGRQKDPWTPEQQPH